MKLDIVFLLFEETFWPGNLQLKHSVDETRQLKWCPYNRNHGDKAIVIL